MQTVEAIIEATGAVRLLSDVRPAKRRRALVTILDEEPMGDDRQVSSIQKKAQLLSAFKRAQEANIFRDIADPSDWKRKLRNEWD